MDKKYVPDGVFLFCDKGTLPSIFSVNPLTDANLYGQRVGNEFDKIPILNIKPHGVCTITKMPCVPVPILWNPVKNDALFGSGRLLQENSKLRCALGGEIKIMFFLPPGMPMPGTEGTSFLDQMEKSMGQLGPLGSYMQFQMGVSEGIFNGGKSMVEGLWSLGTMAVEGGQALDRAVWHAVTHPRETAQGAMNAASGAYNWASNGQNWRDVANTTGQTLQSGYNWASNGQNWLDAGSAAASQVSQWGGQAMDWASTASPRQWGQLTGRAGFEVAATVGTGGTVRGASTAGQVARAADLAGDAGRAIRAGDAAADLARAAKAADTAADAGRAAEAANAAGAVRRTGPVVDGATGRVAREGDDLAGHAGRDGATTRSHPVDVATGLLYTDAIDVELSGTIPFVWDRIWYSRSRHRGALGYGWHHPYDLSIRVDADEVVVLRMADGRQTTFDPPIIDGLPVFDRANQLTLHRPDEKKENWRIWNGRERYWYVFEPPSATGAERPLLAIENNVGHSIRFGYAAGGHLQTITDSASRRIDVETDPKGRILALHGPHPDQANERITLVSYGYDTDGNLATATDAEGHQQHYRYENHLMVQETNAAGLNFYFVYDGTSHTARCVHSWGDGGIYDTRFHYDTETTTHVWDSYGKETFYVHWEGRVTDQIDANGSLWQWLYSPFGELMEDRNSLGHVNRYDHDSRGNQIVASFADGGSVLREFDDEDRLLRYTDLRGGTWQYAYDENGLLTAQTDPLGHQTQFAYDGWGMLVQQTNPLGQATMLRYDSQHQLTHIVNPDNSIRSRTYDRFGRPVVLTDAAGNQEQRTYDRRNRVIQVNEPDGQIRLMAYDGAGNLTQVQANGQTTSCTYTGMNRMASRQQAGTSLSFSYDKEGRLTGLRNEFDQVYRFELDPEGRAISETGFDGLLRRYVRDAAGRLTQTIRPDNRATAYQYDPAGRLTGVQYSDGTGASYRYDKAGGMLTASTGQSQIAFTRDAMGRVVAETQDGHTLTHTYDAAGQRTRLTSSLGADVGFVLSQTGRVTQMQTATGWQASFGYDRRGLEVQRQLSGGISTEWEHDVLGRPTQQRIGQRGHTARQRRYTWTGPDQLTRLDDSLTGATNYQYDPLGYLTGAQYADGSTDVRLADAVGNLFESSTGRDRRYGPGGQLRQAGQVRYNYDPEGNLIQKSTPEGNWQYAWDGAGQLTAVKRPDGYAVQFEYDALGRRTAKHFRGELTRWVWDGDKPLHEWSQYTVGGGSGSPDDLITWLFEAASFAPVAKLTAQGNYSVVTDHLGTPLTLYDQGGRPTWEAQLDSYGRLRRGAGRAQDCPFRFQGQYEDAETGLYYNRFRYYAPQEGTYISQDPIGLESGVYGLYVYAKDPQSTIDAFGLDWNYVLVDRNGKPYYAGRASDNQTMADVARRHGNNVGTDGARYGAGDSMRRVTPVGSDPDLVRGIEQRGIAENPLLGRNNPLRRGNAIDGISSAKQGTIAGQTRLGAADAYLNGRKVSELPTLSELTKPICP